MDMPTEHKPERLAFVGFGEAATAFLDGWADGRPAHVAAFDLKTEDPLTAAGMRARYAAHRVHDAGTLAGTLDEVTAVFSVVTADQALEAARAAAPHVPPGCIWFDCNSCAPDTKRQAAGIIDGAGGRYVDVAVMAPVHPKRHLVPLLVAGPHAAEGVALLEALGMRPKPVGDAVGAASSIKMIRSVMIKGMEALTAECFLAARRAGVEEAVIASLEASDPGVDWRRRGAYNLERMLVHGTRRAAEMREVAATVAALGLSDGMSRATAEWQAALSRRGVEAGEPDLIARIDRALSAL
jgi:3-hydroxyisobutyrate dehydrogenase-like beta-hydroxyacid dehydrogenase